MNPALYLPVKAIVERVIEETPTIKTFDIRPREPMAFEAGQFVELLVPGIGEAPFTPSSSPRVKDHMEITIMQVGRVTSHLHGLEVGAEVGLRGPFGRGYPIESFRGREILLAGGGCGVGPLRALLLDLIEDLDAYERVIVRYGARTPADLVFHDAAKSGWGRGNALDVMLTVDTADSDWDGHVGALHLTLGETVLDCHPENGVAVICGPPVMMRFTVAKLLGRGYRAEDVYVSLERNMSCGLGKCGHCRLGRHYVCADGPVFPYEQVRDEPGLWEA